VDLLSGLEDALIGVAITGLLAVIGATLATARAELRFRLSGEYTTLTTGTAVLDGSAEPTAGVVQRSLRLRQLGTRLRGTEAGGAAETARWEIEAELSPDGFITGRYRQVHPPTGISRGAFFLEQNRVGDPAHFEGRWVGWNPRERRIVSGVYEWRRVSTTPLWKAFVPWSA
jgi:hypothetical protein